MTQVSRRHRARLGLELLEGRAVPATLLVTSSADAGAGTLRAALASAEDGDTIRFAQSLRGRAIELTSGDLVVEDSVAIVGPGAGLLTVNAGGRSRAFTLTSADDAVTISGLTVTGGVAPNGGGILVEGGSLTLMAAAVAGNRAVGSSTDRAARGGGVAVEDGGTLVIDRTTFRDNVAEGRRGPDGGAGRRNGSGGDAAGGGIYLDGASLTVTASRFEANRAVGGRGGDGGVGEGTTSSPASNGAGGGGYGGGIFLQSGALSVGGTTFTGNAAQGGAGGIAATTSEFAFNGWGGVAAGGAVGINPWTYPKPQVQLTGGTYTDNRAVGGDAAPYSGGVWTWGPGGMGGRALGGAIGEHVGNGLLLGGGDGSPIVVAGGTFTGNLVQAGTAGAAWRGGDAAGAAIKTTRPLVVDDARFTANQAFASAGGDAGWRTPGAAGGQGGHIRGGVILAGGLTLTRSRLTDNQAHAGAGGAGSFNWAGRGGDGGAAGLINGGAVFSYDLTMADTTVTGTRAYGAAGGAGQAGADNQHGVGGIGGSVAGGVVLSFNSSILRSRFTGNQAIAGAGGQGVAGYGAYLGSAGGMGGWVVGGVVSAEAADFLTLGSEADFRIASGVFADNLAAAGPGGVGGLTAAGGAGGQVHGGVVLSPYGTVTGSRFTGNLAVAGNGGRGGAGIAATDYSPGLPGGVGGAGGEVRGGVLAYRNWLSTDQRLTVSGTTVSKNSAWGGYGGAGGAGDSDRGGGNGGAGGGVSGGAIYLFTEDWFGTMGVLDATLTGCWIEENAAWGGNGGRAGSGGAGGTGGNALGGGVYVGDRAEVNLVGGRIAWNVAVGGTGGAEGENGGTAGAEGSGYGGGIFLIGRGSTRRGTAIFGNLASTDGDDIWGLFD